MKPFKLRKGPFHKEALRGTPQGGSRKAVIRALFDKQGQEVAWTRGLNMKRKPGSLRTWFGTWRGRK